MWQWLKGWFKRRDFAWDFKIAPRDQDETITIYNEAYNVTGFKEALANNVYQAKKKFVESDGKEVSSLYTAEVYQRILDRMTTAHRVVEKRKASQESLIPSPSIYGRR